MLILKINTIAKRFLYVPYVRVSGSQEHGGFVSEIDAYIMLQECVKMSVGNCMKFLLFSIQCKMKLSEVIGKRLEIDIKLLEGFRNAIQFY